VSFRFRHVVTTTNTSQMLPGRFITRRQDLMEPLNRVNFENRAHQEILKGVLYFVGTREIAGKEPDMGLWASIEQGIAALKGAVSSAVS
ncbi:MAG: hypothetical protein ACYT04_94095, partial [Nostoc sp.]